MLCKLSSIYTSTLRWFNESWSDVDVESPGVVFASDWPVASLSDGDKFGNTPFDGVVGPPVASVAFCCILCMRWYCCSICCCNC